MRHLYLNRFFIGLTLVLMAPENLKAVEAGVKKAAATAAEAKKNTDTKTETTKENPVDEKDSKNTEGKDLTSNAKENEPKLSPSGEKLPPAKLPENIRKIRDRIKIKWYPPEMFTPLDKSKSGKMGISIAGETKPGTRVYMRSDDIFQIGADNAKTKRKLLPDEVKYLPGVVDLRGLFFFELFLPVGKYQVPISVVDPAAPMLQAAKVFHLLLDVTSDKVGFDYALEDEDDPFNPLSDYFTVGLGGNLMVYNKAAPSIPSELRFSSFKFPSLRVGYGKTFNEEWRFSSYFLVAPGATSNGTRVNVTNGNYMWPLLSGDAIYSHKNWKWLWRENYRMRWGLRVGAQYHLIPFIRSINFAETTQTIKSADIQMLTVGGQFDVMTTDDFSYEMLFRVHFPISTGNMFKVKDQFSFDGSIGALYHWPEQKWLVGLYWYGQMLQYNFTETDAFVGREVEGKFNILYSNLELRWTYPL